MSRMVQHSQGKVPFSWEKKPGISKEESLKNIFNTNPIDSEYEHDVQLLPLPPCGFLPPQRSSSKKGLKNQDDPFFAAYMECTKVPKVVTRKNDPNMYCTYSEYDQTQQLYQPLSRPKIINKGEYIHESASKKSLNKQDDSFRECTKNGIKGKSIGNSKNDGVGFGISKNMSIFSCKASCSVRDDSMVFIISKNSSSSKSKKEKGEKNLNYEMQN